MLFIEWLIVFVLIVLVYTETTKSIFSILNIVKLYFDLILYKIKKYIKTNLTIIFITILFL